MRSLRHSLLFTALVITSVSTWSCTGCGETPPPVEPLPLDEALSAGEVRCGPVTAASELIGGPGAYGSVGRTWRCYNNQIRFLVQDGSRPIGNSSVGGSLIDIDLVRGSEDEEGRDSFRELVVAWGANEVMPNSVEVIHDGRDGAPGVVRVSGTPVDITLVPQAHLLHQDMPARVETDYILRPDVSYIEVKTRVINLSDDFIGPLLYADFIVFGAPGKLHAPEIGFNPTEELFRSASLLALGHGEHVSYAYVCSDRDLTIPLAERTITAPVCRDDVQIGISEEYSRYLFVGDGTLNSVAAPAWKLRGLPTGNVQGTVTDAMGVVTGGVWVTALSGGGLGDEDAFVVNEARSDDTGHYELTLRPGTYTLVAHRPGADRSDEKEVVIDEGADASRTLQLGAGTTLRVRTNFTGADGTDLGRLPAKLSVEPLDETQRPSEMLADFKEQGLTTYQPSPDGRFEVPLSPGRYRVYVSRGFEFTQFEAELTIAAGETVELAAGLVHALDTTGYVGAEFHQHSLGSTDSSIPIAVKVLENAAEGVEVASSTEHDNVVDFRPYVEALGLAEHLMVMAGNEVTYTAIGHFNVYPWAIDEADPFKDVGSRVWFGKTLPELFADVATRAGDPVIQMNHPRSGSAGVFQALLLDPLTGQRFGRGRPTLPTLPETVYEEWSPAFHAIEVNGSLGSPTDFTEEGWAELSRRARTDATDVPVLADWFGLMGSGLHVAAMGNSDTHRENEGVGYPRNFLYLGEDDPTQVTEAMVRDAIRAQKVTIGNGCLVELLANGDRRMGVGEKIAATDLAELKVRVQAPPHAEVERLELYVNGRVQRLTVDQTGVTVGVGDQLAADLLPLAASAPAAVRLDAAIDGVAMDEDVVIVALARGGARLSPAGYRSSFCVSAPLYVDAGGDGWVGWLADTQTIAD